MSPDTNQPAARRHGRHAFIPAGIFLGLGVGILLGYVVPGVLIGLGLGFLASSFFAYREAADTGDGSLPSGRHAEMVWPPVLIGIFLILLGIGIVWAPAMVWPYLFAALLILIGIGFLYRGIRNRE